MARKDPRIDAYIAAAAPFAQPILKHLRKIVHAGCPEVEETMKWSMPHFDYKGMMCHMAGFKAHCGFGFWDGDRIFKDKKAVEEEAMGHFGRITSIADLPPEKTMIGYVKQAVELKDAGVKRPPRKKAAPAEKKPATMPDDFASALRANEKAQTAFDAFTPSQRKEYIEWITDAKREETREQRLGTALEWIAEGKTRHWKYQRT
jgi:uncharacterized protein YdeI (YjbR/CyaY-like superfamily)